MPIEVKKYMKTSGKRLVYSTDEIQERDSVLCGYWCLYYLLERQKGRSILETIHNSKFDMSDTSVNHRFVINYFKNIYLIYIMYKPYCGARKVPKNRVRGTSEQCIKSGQARYYGIMSVENEINRILAEKKKLANEKAKMKRQEAKKKVDDANKKIKQANVAVKEAKKPAAKKTTANNKIRPRRPTTSTKKIKPINQNINDVIKQLST